MDVEFVLIYRPHPVYCSNCTVQYLLFEELLTNFRTISHWSMFVSAHISLAAGCKDRGEKIRQIGHVIGSLLNYEHVSGSKTDITLSFHNEMTL